MNQMNLEMPRHAVQALKQEAPIAALLVAVPVNEIAKSILEIKLWRTDWMD